MTTNDFLLRPSRTWEEHDRKIRITQRKLSEATGKQVSFDDTLKFMTALTWAGSEKRIS